MPNISDRMNIDTSYFTTVDIPQPINTPVFSDNQSESTHTGMRLISIGGNSVPMRGIHPVEMMTDTDLYRFYPYSAYADRKWTYTYYALFNSGR